MDWHFRQNRRIKNQSKQTLCRGWQDISEDDWIESKTVEGKFTSRFFFFFFFFFFIVIIIYIIFSFIKKKKNNKIIIIIIMIYIYKSSIE